MGRRQAVRHRLLEPAFVGSNPTAPANFFPNNSEKSVLVSHRLHEPIFDQHSSWLVVDKIVQYDFENNNFFGLVLGFSGYAIFVLLDSIIKLYLVQKYPVLEINFFICLFAFIPIIVTLTVVGNWNTLINNKIHIQLLRGVLGVICGALIVNSFKRHALIEIYPILFSTPLILTILSYFVLKEKVGIRRWSAVLIGFIGVLIVSRPGTIHFTLPLFGLFFCSYYSCRKCFNHSSLG